MMFTTEMLTWFLLAKTMPVKIIDAVSSNKKIGTPTISNRLIFLISYFNLSLLNWSLIVVSLS